jgi:hypothetical protein
MNLRTKVLSCAAALITAASLSVVPLAAHAEGGTVSDTVNFTGSTLSLTCTLGESPTEPNPPLTCGGAMNGVPFVGGEGTYSFAGPCTYTSDAKGPGETSPEVGGCSIQSSGTYESLICGTGEATGTATVLPAPADPTEGGSISYNIDFVNGFGTFDPDALEAGPATSGGADLGQVPGSDLGPGEADGPNTVTENESAGVTYAAFLNTDPSKSFIVLTPGAPGAAGSGICVQGFSVVGQAEIDEAPGAP